VVIGDSTSFTDATGPQLPGHPTLYPNVIADHLRARTGREVEVTVLARPGATVREAVQLVHKDRHAQFDVLARADAVVVGIGSFDHAPAGVPAALGSLVPYLRPDRVRRQVRSLLAAAQPVIVRATGGRRSRTPNGEFDRLFVRLLDQVRGLTQGRAAGVVLGPTSHRSRRYGEVHPHHTVAEARQFGLARSRGFATVSAWQQVLPFVDQLNPDGIHWPAAAHAAIGDAVADALMASLGGDEPSGTVIRRPR
jgi:hypothetical protein